MKNNVGKIFALFAAGCLAACSTVTVSTDYDHNVSFSKYRTYTLTVPRNKLTPGSEAVLRHTLQNKLLERGIRLAVSGRPDLDIVAHVSTQQKLAVQHYTDWDYGYSRSYGWTYPYGSYGLWTGAPTTYTDIHQYTEGTLILDFVDTHTNRLVMRGVGKAVVGTHGENANNIGIAVDEIIDEMPH